MPALHLDSASLARRRTRSPRAWAVPSAGTTIDGDFLSRGAAPRSRPLIGTTYRQPRSPTEQKNTSPRYKLYRAHSRSFAPRPPPQCGPPLGCLVSRTHGSCSRDAANHCRHSPAVLQSTGMAGDHARILSTLTTFGFGSDIEAGWRKWTPRPVAEIPVVGATVDFFRTLYFFATNKAPPASSRV